MRNAFYTGISHTFYRYFNEKTAISHSFFNDFSYICPVSVSYTHLDVYKRQLLVYRKYLTVKVVTDSKLLKNGK